MTLQHERDRAIEQARVFLHKLVMGEYKRVPAEVRDAAQAVLRHYPTNVEFEMYYQERAEATE